MKRDTSPVDSWGTPEHEAAMERLTAGHLSRCAREGRHIRADETCCYISDERLAAMRRNWEKYR
jgi:hypothetical protein